MADNGSRNGDLTGVQTFALPVFIGLLAAIAIPNFVKARNTSQANACINNMRQVDSADQQWALETRSEERRVGKENRCPSAAYNKRKAIPSCPQRGLINQTDLNTA